METARDGLTEAQRYHRVALLADAPEQLPGLGAALRQVAREDVSEVAVWLRVDRFQAPAGTHPPYRELARIEARNITAERVNQARIASSEQRRSWESAGWRTSFEALLHESPSRVASRLVEAEIDLLVAPAASRSSDLGSRAAGQAACPLLLVPSADAATNPRNQKPSLAPRLLRALHG